MLYSLLLIVVVLSTTAYVCYSMISDFIQKPYRKENSGKVLVERSYFPEKRTVRPELIALAKKLSIEDELVENYKRGVR